METDSPFIQNLSERLSLVDIGHPQAVMDAMAVSMAELVRGLKSAAVFEEVSEAVSYEPDTGIVTGVLYVKPGTWSLQHQSLTFFILRQGFVYTPIRSCYEYKLEI